MAVTNEQQDVFSGSVAPQIKPEVPKPTSITVVKERYRVISTIRNGSADGRVVTYSAGNYVTDAELDPKDIAEWVESGVLVVAEVEN